MFEYYFRGRKDGGEWVYGGIVAITGTDDFTDFVGGEVEIIGNAYADADE